MLTNHGEEIPLRAVVSNCDSVRTHRELINGAVGAKFEKRRRHGPRPRGRSGGKAKGKGGADSPGPVRRAGSTPDGKDAPRDDPLMPIEPHQRAPVLFILWWLGGVVIVVVSPTLPRLSS